ncbi:MAG: antibiotic ABC transporter ATP-binding protein [Planctomycetes bacterium]|nr:antibiotic ABC transporter ATP-binding protein [Planctomycetota bacterium]
MSHKDGDDLSGKVVDARLLRRLLAFARPHARGFLGSTFLLLCLAVLTLSVPEILGSAVDEYIVGDEAESLTDDARGSGVRSTALILAGIGLLTFGARLAQITLTNRTGQRVIHDLRLAVYSHVTRRSLRFFDRNPVGMLVTRVTGDIETLNEFFVSGVDVLFSDFIRILAIIGLLLFIDWQMALATLAVVPLILLWAFVFQRRARKLFREVRGEVSRLNGYMNEALSGVQVVRSFGREATIQAKFQGMSSDLRNAHLKTVRNFSWFFPGMELITAMGMSAVLVTGYHLVIGGRIAPGDVVKFWLYLTLFIEPLRQLADKYNILQAAVAAGERVFRVLDDDSALKIAETPTSLSDSRGRVHFDNVHFAYDEEKPVLRGVSFDVEPGSRIAFVGPTGSGKSTIINLLCRFYDPGAGRVLLDGKDLRDVDPHELRRRIGVVLQDVFLFEGTVRENLTLGADHLSDEVLARALEAVQADAVVARLGGLDGRIRERGATLSTGEKQLLAFARTLAHDPALLVLDEATAHIDTESEILFQRALDKVMEGRTAIVIAHRLSTIQECDRILVLHHGEVRESGTHDELLRQNGIYARLYRLQFEGA